ncbi:MAG: MarR family winged helix-turn-helix transcriptional regulator [Omnitrophica WOR_2 bacterium]
MAASPLSGEAQALLVIIGKRLEKSGDEFFKDIGLSASQFEIMRILWQQDNLTLGELSNFCCCAPPNITGLVDRLEKKGLLRRIADLKDRRIARIALTEAGRNLREPTAEVIERYLSLFQVFQPGELRELVRMLKLFYRHIEGEGAELFIDMLAKQSQE